MEVVVTLIYIYILYISKLNSTGMLFLQGPHLLKVVRKKKNRAAGTKLYCIVYPGCTKWGRGAHTPEVAGPREILTSVHTEGQRAISMYIVRRERNKGTLVVGPRR